MESRPTKWDEFNHGTLSPRVTEKEKIIFTFEMFIYVVNVGGVNSLLKQRRSTWVYLTLLPRNVRATSLSKPGSWYCNCFKETL